MTKLDSEIVERIRAADDALGGVSVRPELDWRVRRTLKDESAGSVRDNRPWTWALAGTMAGALAAVAVMSVLFSDLSSKGAAGDEMARRSDDQSLVEAPRPPPRGAAAPGNCAMEESPRGLALRSGCSTFSLNPSMRIQAETKSWISVADDAVRVVEGRVTFDVDPVEPGEPPVQVLVSAGRIVVMGTRFTVDESGESGAVELHEGSIRFVTVEGRASVLEPGESTTWTVEEVGEPPASKADHRVERSTSARPTSSVSGERADDRSSKAVSPTSEAVPKSEAIGVDPHGRDLEALLERLAELRELGAFDRMARLLKSALPDLADASAAEILSFELAEVLVESKADDACAHLMIHNDRFDDGAYETEVKRMIRRLGCRRSVSTGG